MPPEIKELSRLGLDVRAYLNPWGETLRTTLPKQPERDH